MATFFGHFLHLSCEKKNSYIYLRFSEYGFLHGKTGAKQTEKLSFRQSRTEYICTYEILTCGSGRKRALLPKSTAVGTNWKGEKRMTGHPEVSFISAG